MYAVIGAGIEGSATAYFLAKNGAKVTLFDQFRQGHTRGSSHGNSRITRKAYDTPIYVQMMKKGYQLWDELEKSVGEQLFKQTGLLYLGTVDGPVVTNVINSMITNNLPCTVLNNKQISEKYPQLKFDSNWRAVYDPEAGLLKADRCLRAFQTEFVKNGGVMHEGDAVVLLETDGKIARLQTASGKKFTFDGVAICVGTWARSFLKQNLALDLPLQPRVVKSCYWKVTKSGLYSADNGFPCILSKVNSSDGHYEDDQYGLPSDEYADMIKFCSAEGIDIDHPDERDSVDANLYIQKPQRYLAEHFDHVQAKPAVVETCLFTVTPDEDFVLDKHPKYGNIVIGAGFSGHGFKLAPVVGEILATLLKGDRMEFDLSTFSIARFKK